MRQTAPTAAGIGLAGLCTALCAFGCADESRFVSESRLDKGLVVILPGIEGRSGLNEDIRRGLDRAGVGRAMPIHSWGRPVPFVGVLVNQVDFLGNRLAGIGVARMIMNYQDSHPGKPVHIVGHSGGGGVAVFAAEALPEDRKIDGLVLLSASISNFYDLRKPLSRCRNGIVNFYNPADAALLGIGTTVLGNVDGLHGPSAGLISFKMPGDSASDEKKEAYKKLFQVKVADGSDDDPHAAATRPGFVAASVAPWVLSGRWPAASAWATPASEPAEPNALAQSGR
jgi:pimeloyl-ACP methyl ester carboxylesterase